MVVHGACLFHHHCQNHLITSCWCWFGLFTSFNFNLHLKKKIAGGKWIVEHSPKILAAKEKATINFISCSILHFSWHSISLSFDSSAPVLRYDKHFLGIALDLWISVVGQSVAPRRVDQWKLVLKRLGYHSFWVISGRMPSRRQLPFERVIVVWEESCLLKTNQHLADKLAVRFDGFLRSIGTSGWGVMPDTKDRWGENEIESVRGGKLFSRCAWHGLVSILCQTECYLNSACRHDI